jgi:hypothetical protein
MKTWALYMNDVKCNRYSAIKLIKRILIQMLNIYKDDNGYFFYSGNGDNIENLYNHKILNDYRDDLKETFRNNKNWDNFYSSPNMVCNLLRWCFTIICKVYPYPYVKVLVPKYKFTINKYYIPKCIMC